MFFSIQLSRLVKYVFIAVGLSIVMYTIAQLVPPETAAVDQMKKASVLIIDPGHGGEDGGAVAADGTKESDVNWDIAQRVYALAQFCGARTCMTRQTCEIAYPNQADTTARRKAADQHARVDLINSIPDGVLLSIHQNQYPSSKPRGPQVLFALTSGSQQFGDSVQQALTETLYPENVRTAVLIPKSIYITKMVHCPAILVECGFLSNPDDLKLLKTPEYRLKTAVVLATASLRYLYFTSENEIVL